VSPNIAMANSIRITRGIQFRAIFKIYFSNPP
jgi:hypothetical protein